LLTDSCVTNYITSYLSDRFTYRLSSWLTE